MRVKVNSVRPGLQPSGEELQQQIEDRLESKARLQISEDDVARMVVAAFAASNGGVTKCMQVNAALSPQYRL